MAFVDVSIDGQHFVNYDEFHQIKMARYITANEAFLSLWGFPLVSMSKEVKNINLHNI